MIFYGRKKKKKKLTLTVSSAKPHSGSHFPQSKGKTSVVIEKKSPRKWSEKKTQSREGYKKPSFTFSIMSGQQFIL